MNRPPVLVVLIAPDHTHAADAGSRVAMCGAVGVPLLTMVRSSFDFTCERCVPLVQDALGLTALNDPDNVGFRVIEGEKAPVRCVTCGQVTQVEDMQAHLCDANHTGFVVVTGDQP